MKIDVHSWEKNIYVLFPYEVSQTDDASITVCNTHTPEATIKKYLHYGQPSHQPQYHKKELVKNIHLLKRERFGGRGNYLYDFIYLSNDLLIAFIAINIIYNIF